MGWSIRIYVAQFLSFLLMIVGVTSGGQAAPLPLPFGQAEAPKIALVRYVTRGEFFTSYLAGVRHQAEALGAELLEFDARQQPALQSQMIDEAIAKGVSGIILQHGRGKWLTEAVERALSANIAVVAFDVDMKHEKIPQIEQSDSVLSELLIGQMLKDKGYRFKVGYISVPGPAPLERRDMVWQDFKEANEGVQEVANFGSMKQPIARYIANQARAVLTANPDIEVIFAPYDEFARGAKIAVKEAGLADQIRIYSADITDSDIAEMREEGSPWVATAATNPLLLGKICVRSVAMLMAGEDPGHKIVVAPRLITQEQLNELDIQSLKDLARKVPAFADQPIAQPVWMP